jgi:GTPase SAR1 family protein
MTKTKIGAAGVGKTALVSQFMTSEYMNTYDASLGRLCAMVNICIVVEKHTPISNIHSMSALYSLHIQRETLIILYLNLK